jgi:hypothetical protein
VTVKNREDHRATRKEEKTSALAIDRRTGKSDLAKGYDDVHDAHLE